MAIGLNGSFSLYFPHSPSELASLGDSIHLYNNFNFQKSDGSFLVVNAKDLATDARNYGTSSGIVNIITNPLSETLVFDDEKVIPHANVFHIFCNALTKFTIQDMTSFFNAREQDPRFTTPDVATYTYNSFYQSMPVNADPTGLWGYVWHLQSFCSFDWGPTLTTNGRDDSCINITNLKMGCGILKQSYVSMSQTTCEGFSKHFLYNSGNTVQASVKAVDPTLTNFYTNFQSFIGDTTTPEGAISIKDGFSLASVGNCRGSYMGGVGKNKENFTGQTLYETVNAKIASFYQRDVVNYNNVDWLTCCGMVE